MAFSTTSMRRDSSAMPIAWRYCPSVKHLSAEIARRDAAQ
jgi:hypothetical protein